jgi:nitrogen fixation-related uncharacterized protein
MEVIMRLVIFALVLLSIGFFAFYWAFSLGAKHAQDTPSPNEKKRGLFSRKSKPKKASLAQPLLLTQLVDLQTELLNRNFAEASLKLGEMHDLTDSYKHDWKTALDNRDEGAIQKMTQVIDDLKVVLRRD